ncbi:MAG: hypothetical protein U9R06_00325 [Patescibacteria group bacterium]|nr:hypothetical protein [Patescibacteria group bacterium]
MKILIRKNKLLIAPEMILRQAGYNYIIGRDGRQDSFAREFSRTGYPRFHIYLKYKNDIVEFNLHLDQKKPSYAGSRAHSGEYNGAVVEAEINRLKKLIIELVNK